MEVALNVVSEQGSEKSDIHFEPGMHPLTGGSRLALYTDFSNGDLDVFAHTNGGTDGKP